VGRTLGLADLVLGDKTGIAPTVEGIEMWVENGVFVYLDGAELAEVYQEKKADFRGYPEEHGIPKDRSENHDGRARLPHFALIPFRSLMLLSAAGILYPKKP